MSEINSDNDVAIIRWITIMNIILIVTTALSVYYISPWMFFMLVCFTTYSRKDDKDGQDKQI